jgi:2'-5' RNA ligase
MRAFIALQLPQVFIRASSELAHKLSGTLRGRYLAPDSYHVTLAFLGKLPKQKMPHAIEAINVSCSETEPLLLTPSGLGVFGRPENATLWLGFMQTAELDKFDASLRRNLAIRGISFAGHPFKAHLSLARHVHASCKSPRISCLPQATRCTSIGLFESRLLKTGATYACLYSKHLLTNNSISSNG